MKEQSGKGFIKRYIEGQKADLQKLRKNLSDGRDAVLEYDFGAIPTPELEREVTIFRRARNGVAGLAGILEGEAIFLGATTQAGGGLTWAATIVGGGAIYCEVNRRRRNRELKRRNAKE